MRLGEKKEESLLFLGAAVLLGLVFGFDDGREVFVQSLWIQNFLQQIVFVLLLLLLCAAITRYVARKSGVSVSFQVWKTQRFGWGKSSTLQRGGMYWGIILPLFITLFSAGNAMFSAVINPVFHHTKASRLGHKFAQPKESELATIALAGPLVLALVGVFIASKNSNAAIVPFSLAFCMLLPLPRLNGLVAMIGAPARYIFSIVLVIAMFGLTRITSPTQSIFLGLVFAALISSAYYLASFMDFKA